MTEHTEDRGHRKDQISESKNSAERKGRGKPKQGEAHYLTKPFPFAVELGFFAGFIWGQYIYCFMSSILRLYL